MQLLAALALASAGDLNQSQKLVDQHRGVTINFPLGSLAHLQLARVLAMSNDTAGARGEYQHFFARWKDADSDIPIRRTARAE